MFIELIGWMVPGSALGLLSSNGTHSLMLLSKCFFLIFNNAKIFKRTKI